METFKNFKKSKIAYCMYSLPVLNSERTLRKFLKMNFEKFKIAYCKVDLRENIRVKLLLSFYLWKKSYFINSNFDRSNQTGAN